MTMLYTLTIPHADNDGNAIPAQVFERIEASLCDIAGGWSSLPVRGGWKGDDGTYYVDHSTRFECHADASLTTDVQMTDLAHWARVQCSQEAILLTIGGRAVFVTADYAVMVD